MIRAPRCPYCHDAVSRGDALVVCRECHAFHHDACFREGAGCAACRHALAVGAGAPWRGRRLAAALSVFFGFLFGEVLASTVTVVTHTSEVVERVVPRACEKCCPRHHHDCH